MIHTALKQSALAFLEMQVLSFAEHYLTPGELVLIDAVLATKLSGRGHRHIFIYWMQEQKGWQHMITDDLSMTETELAECYEDPMRFRDFVNTKLWETFCWLVEDFEQAVTDALVKNGYLAKDTY
jgi:hypothetical protein